MKSSPCLLLLWSLLSRVASASTNETAAAADDGVSKRSWFQSKNDLKMQKQNANTTVLKKTQRNKKKRKKKHVNRTRCALYKHRFRQPERAYRMAVLASLAYWHFHKQPIVESSGYITGFSLIIAAKTWRQSIVALLLQASPMLCFESKRQSTMPRNLVQQDGKRNDEYTFVYYFYNWHEPSLAPGVNFHDTDLLVSLDIHHNLQLAFGGTVSLADAFTNMQTFEPAKHGQLFHVNGSMHRGFLNAYGRVERGSVVRLGRRNETRGNGTLSMIPILDRDFGNCWLYHPADTLKNVHSTNSTSSNSPLVHRRKNGSCRVHNTKLMTILRELVVHVLQSGREVQLVGHSLGGGIATIMALDILLNFPQVPVSKLTLWTFGAPQVADHLFLQSAMAQAPRLRSMLQKRYHRFVTLSDQCQGDFVAEVTKNALPSHQRNLRGRAARKLGGVRGHVVHFDVNKPHYLLTPEQWMEVAVTAAEKSTTRSTLAAHSMVNYFRGISRESRHHPLTTNLPPEMALWLQLLHEDDLLVNDLIIN
ncbi:hypothetical protein MPSEU_000627200 [Mayamaea pseudoterrestris]|nr:hypothetical protein MPSEU_000627200 [Mayamaea pseudoterrestris]